MGRDESKQDVLDFVKARVSEPGSAFQVATSSFRYEGRSAGYAELSEIWAAVTPFGATALRYALRNVAWDKTGVALKAAQREMAVSDMLPQQDDELRKWVKLLERPDTTKERHEASVFVMKQWMWQVKQAVAQRKPRWHVAPIFWSREQGTGKSYNVLRILEPLKLFTRHLHVDDLDDSFGASLIANTYVAFLDEFAGADKVNAAKLKAVMSGKEISQREMRAMTGIHVENRMSIIATSNEDPPHGLEDVTGARRMWSIHCSGRSMQNDAQRRMAFDKLDVAAMWAAVRSDDPCPHEVAKPALLRYMDAVREETLRAKTAIELFVSEVTVKDPSVERQPLKLVRERFNQYAAETRQSSFRGGYGKFAQALKNSGCKVVKPGGYWYVEDMRFRREED